MHLRDLEHVGPAPCYTIGVNIMRTKERPDVVETLLGWIRAKDPMHCPIGALAGYMVHWLDIGGFQLLYLINNDLRDLEVYGKDNYDPKWRKVYLLNASSPYAPLSSTTHNQDMNKVLDGGE